MVCHMVRFRYLEKHDTVTERENTSFICEMKYHSWTNESEVSTPVLSRFSIEKSTIQSSESSIVCSSYILLA